MSEGGEENKQVAVEDSNMALVGSEEDKAARKAAAQTETAWENCGRSPGLEIWRIEQFKVVPWPKDQYGYFYKGDCYIVLKTNSDPKSGKLSWDIHYWIGSECTTDEKGTAAYKTVELDDLFDGAPVQHRQVEAHESRDFVKLFEQLNYLEGGIESGFNHIEPDAYIAKLLMVRNQDGSTKVIQVPLSAASFNQGDCFVLDSGAKVYTWHGEQSSPFERHKCCMVAHNIVSNRLGKSRCIQWDEDEEGFWSLLGGKAPIASAEEGNLIARSKTLEEVGEGILYKLSDESGKLMFTEVARGDVNSGMLDSNDVFVLDTTEQLFVWIGQNSSETERRKAFETAEKYLSSMERPFSTPVTVFREGQAINNRIWNQIMSS
mgnify:FL=1